MKTTDEDDNTEPNDEDGDEDEDDEENDSDDGYYTDAHRSGRRRRHHHHHHRQNDMNRSLMHCPHSIGFRPLCCSSSRRRKSDASDSSQSPPPPPRHQLPSSNVRSNPLRLLLGLFQCCVRPKTELTERSSSGDPAVPSALLVSSAKPKKSSNSLEEYVERPPVTCIRVLRPSNDLTPVRFDSHYNIIQAVSNGSFSGPSDGAAPSLPSPPSTEASKTAADVITSIMEDALKQQNATTTTTTTNDFTTGTFTKV